MPICKDHRWLLTVRIISLTEQLNHIQTELNKAYGDNARTTMKKWRRIKRLIRSLHKQFPPDIIL